MTHHVNQSHQRLVAIKSGRLIPRLLDVSIPRLPIGDLEFVPTPTNSSARPERAVIVVNRSIGESRGLEYAAEREAAAAELGSQGCFESA